MIGTSGSVTATVCRHLAAVSVSVTVTVVGSPVMTGGEFGVTVTVRALDVDPQLSEHVTVSVNDDVPPNVGLFASSTVYVDAAKFKVNMALVGELDIVHVYGSVSVTARVCRVRLPASPAATLEVAGRLVMSGGVFACTLTVNTPVEAVPSEHCNVRA